MTAPDDSFMDLADTSVEEAVLEAATEALRAEIRLEALPRFVVLPNDDDDWKPEATFGVECRFNEIDHYLADDEIAFDVPRVVVKAIALGRPGAVRAFAAPFLDRYRARAAESLLDICLVRRGTVPRDFAEFFGADGSCLDDMFGSARSAPDWLRDLWDELEAFWPDDLKHWSIEGVSVVEVDGGVIRLRATCQDASFDQRLEDDVETHGDLAEAAFDLSWRDFNRYTADGLVRRLVLDRILHGLSTEIAAERLTLSWEAEELKERHAQLLNLDEDEDLEGKDSGLGAEPIEEADGRVHSASDLGDR